MVAIGTEWVWFTDNGLVPDLPSVSAVCCRLTYAWQQLHADIQVSWRTKWEISLFKWKPRHWGEMECPL